MINIRFQNCAELLVNHYLEEKRSNYSTTGIGPKKTKTEKYFKEQEGGIIQQAFLTLRIQF